MRKCAICGLSTGRVLREKLPVGFHRFPRDPTLRKLWDDFCGAPGDRICSAHFEDSCFRGGTRHTGPENRHKLNDDAVPTIREGLPLEPAKLGKKGRPKGSKSKLTLPSAAAGETIKPEYVCRICQSSQTVLHDLTMDENTAIARRLNSLTNIVIRQLDSLPRWLCEICIGRLNDAYDFVQQCAQAEDQLQSHFFVPQQEVKVEAEDYSAEPLVELFEPAPLDETAYCDHDSDDDDDDENDEGYEATTKKLHQCETCQATFERKTDLFAHFKTHGKSRFVCKLCDKTFPRRSQLLEHENIHKAEYSYFCPHCSVGFKNRNNLARHVRALHMGLRPFACEDCGKTFAQKTHYRVHLRTHVKEVEIVCELCFETFQSADLLRDHIKLLHPADPKQQLQMSPTECETCHKVFDTNESLTAHQHKHREANILCNVCGRKFTTKALLMVHMPKHTKEQPYSCVLCPRKFSYEKDLQYHRLVHAGAKPFSCDICERSFRTRTQLKSHKALHDGIKSFECSVCYKRFARAANMRTHMKVHSGHKQDGSNPEVAF